MRKSTKVILIGCFLLMLALIAYAQRPTDYGPDGVPFLRVNINPTDIPPEVNINPQQFVPSVAVAQMPDLKFAATGCSSRQNFHTSIGDSIAGPLVVTYLNVSEQTAVTLVDSQRGEQRVDLSPQTQVATSIYLEEGQTLHVDSNIMYSGCMPD
jgi:hypothetical protein